MQKIKKFKKLKTLPYNLEYTGIHKDKETEMQLFIYDDATLEEYKDFKQVDFYKKWDNSKNHWFNIHGLNNLSLLKTISLHFNIDDFMLADILNISARTKIEEQKDILFFNIKSILPTKNSDNIDVEQISFVLKKGVLISFQEKRSDFFTHIRDRLRNYSGLVRTKNVDYLLFILLDTVIENFYITIETEENKLEKLINEAKKSDDLIILEKIEKHRDNFNFLKRSIIPLRDSLYNIKNIKNDNVFNEIEDDTFSFFDRLHQKTLELLEQIASDMGALESATNFFFSAQSNKMNEIMKTLTIISAIFIPLTFIAGVYGMNFENMPELKWVNGYYITISGMIFIVIFMIIYFKIKKWF